MANKNIRSSQLLSPFGIGQIINFPQEVSLMVCGLDLWDENIKQARIKSGSDKIDEGSLRIADEPRLQKLLNVDYFVKPFPYKTSGLKNNYLKIPAVRFPQWHYCTNPNCGRMEEIELTRADGKIECKACSNSNDRYKAKMIPVRFIAACSEGHIQDVPFKEWVHKGPVPDDNKKHHLSYHSLPGSGDLGSILIKCSCGAKRTLAGLMNSSENSSALANIGLEIIEESSDGSINPSGQYCRGYRPWLGTEGINDTKVCGKHLKVLIRGASNVHYSNIISALYLPQTTSDTDEYVSKIINRFSKEKLHEYYTQQEDGMMLKMFLLGQPEVTNKLISIDVLYNGVVSEIDSFEKDMDSDNASEDDLRQDEYKYILHGQLSETSDFKAVVNTFENYRDRDILDKYFESVVLVEKLKETRVFKGFSRITPKKDTDMTQLSNKKIKWLPAVEVFGEGIFLKFRDDRIDGWKKENSHEFNRIINRYNEAMLQRKPEDERREIDASFIMMHTFAHLLIKRLVFNSGYGSSSLRERIYFSNSSSNRMNGILIYTSSGDSEGSLGGLVRQGKAKNLGKIVKDSIEDARWCSADPVCSDIGQSSGQGPDNINGSACHNCVILPETSCEEFNMLLDRATITGTLDKEIGFFNS